MARWSARWVGSSRWVPWAVGGGVAVAAAAAVVIAVAVVPDDPSPTVEVATEFVEMTVPTSIPVTTTTLSAEQLAAQAVDAITTAVTRAYDGLSPIPDRMVHVRDGAALVSAVEQARSLMGQNAGMVRAEVSDVVIESAERATYVAHLFTGANPLTTFRGSAVRADGSWKVSRFTLCRSIGLLGVACPADTTGFAIDETVDPTIGGGGGGGAPAPNSPALVVDSGFLTVTADGVTTGGSSYLTQNCPPTAHAMVFVVFRDGVREQLEIDLAVDVPAKVDIGGRPAWFWYAHNGRFCIAGSGNSPGR